MTARERASGAVDDSTVDDIPPEGLDEDAGQESDYVANVADDDD